MSFLTNLVSTISGGETTYRSEQLLYDKVIGVRGIVDGVGVSTIVYNLAAALADSTHYHICVLDTHMLYPTLRGLMCTQAAPAKDWFDFTADLSEIVCTTKLRNVKYVGFYHRTLLDALSAKDCRATLDNLMNTLKEVFDVILVDISTENTVIATNAAVQCNKIYTVVSPEPACMFAFKTSINTAVTTAVPAYKLRNVIFNKSIGRGDSVVMELLKENKFNVMCRIAYSDEFIRYNWTGNSFWGAITRSTVITEGNNALAILVKDITEQTTLNQKYLTNDGEHNIDMESIQIDENTMSDVVAQQYRAQEPVKSVQQTNVQQGSQQKESDVNGNLGNVNSVNRTPMQNRNSMAGQAQAPASQRSVMQRQNRVAPMGQGQSKNTGVQGANIDNINRQSIQGTQTVKSTQQGQLRQSATAMPRRGMYSPVMNKPVQNTNIKDVTNNADV